MASPQFETRNIRLIMLIVILLFALSLRLFYFVGIGINDDTEYADSAFRIATGNGLHSYAIGSIDSIRFFMVLPVAFFYWLFGVSDLTSSLYPLSCSMLTIFLAYVAAKNLFTWEVGISTALMLALFPLDLVYCTQLVPTVPLACALTGSLLCFIKGDLLNEKKEKGSSRKANLLFLFSGILIGIGWMINEPAPLFGIVIVLYPLLKWKFRVNYLLFIVGAVGVFLVESLFFKIMTGDFLWRLTVIHEEEKRVLTNTAMDYYPITFFKIKNINFSASQGHFGFFWYLFIGASLYVLAFRKKQIFFLLFGMWLILLYFQFGIMTLGGRPIVKWIRYMEMILPFATMITSFALISFGKMGKAKWKGWTVLFLFLLTDLWFIPRAVEAHRDDTRPMEQIAKFLRQQPGDKPIYIDAGAMGFVDVKEAILRQSGTPMLSSTGAEGLLRIRRCVVSFHGMGKMPLLPGNS
jgi:4-amino-4-deoxy-L-arabinose transferase-like glycosyltransferase